jgi:hypothetical protein
VTQLEYEVENESPVALESLIQDEQESKTNQNKKAKLTIDANFK